MLFRQLYDQDSSTYTYLLADPETGDAALIDPVLEQVERDLEYLDELGLRLVYTLETHTHADHVTGASALREHTGSKIVVSHNGPQCADVFLRDGDVLEVGGVEIEVLETPGHTDDSLTFKVGDRLFTGDTMLLRRTGRSDFQNGDAEALYDSIHQKLLPLADGTRVYPGHDYRGRTESTIGEERRLSMATQGSREEVLRSMRASSEKPAPRKFDLAVPANLRCGVLEGGGD